MTKDEAAKKLADVNHYLGLIKYPTRLQIQARNGYHGLDVYDNNTGLCVRTVSIGTRLRMLEVAEFYLLDCLKDHVKKIDNKC